jgi:hypothetical protein
LNTPKRITQQYFTRILQHSHSEHTAKLCRFYFFPIPSQKAKAYPTRRSPSCTVSHSTAMHRNAAQNTTSSNRGAAVGVEMTTKCMAGIVQGNWEYHHDTLRQWWPHLWKRIPTYQYTCAHTQALPRHAHTSWTTAQHFQSHTIPRLINSYPYSE